MKSSCQIPRIRSYLFCLESQKYSREARLTFWRLIISSAHDALEQELSEMDELNAVHSDPAWTSAVGVIVE